jgi:nucleotide-binding universal stress UspA family protein
MTEPGARSSLSVETVLVPVDGTDESTAATEYAVALADQYGATLRIVYVLGESVVRALDTGLAGDEELAEDHDAYLDELRSMAADADVPISTMLAYGFSTSQKTRHPGSVVLDTAEDLDADFLVVPRQAQDDPGVLAKTAEYVLSYASQPVLSV